MTHHQLQTGGIFTSHLLLIQITEHRSNIGIERTLNTFCERNAPIINEIHTAEADGSLDTDTAWNLIVELTSQTIDWAFNETYRNEIILINRDILMSEENGQELPQAAFILYELFEKLFASCSGMKNQTWIKTMCFSLVTSAFDYANYPRVLNHVLGCNAHQPENQTTLKTHAKDYLLTCIRANLNAHTDNTTFKQRSIRASNSLCRVGRENFSLSKN